MVTVFSRVVLRSCEFSVDTRWVMGRFFFLNGCYPCFSLSFPFFYGVCSAIHFVPGACAQSVDTPQITVLLLRCGCFSKGVLFTLEIRQDSYLSFVAQFLLNDQGFLNNDTAPLKFKVTSLTKQMWSLLLCLICICFNEPLRSVFKFSLPTTVWQSRWTVM